MAPAEEQHVPPPFRPFTDAEWAELEGVLLRTDPARGSYGGMYGRRLLCDAVLHWLWAECTWSDLPDSFPPGKTVQTFWQTLLRHNVEVAATYRRLRHMTWEVLPRSHGASREPG